MPHCIKHDYIEVNNRYDKQGKPVIENGTWRTEKRCEKCNELFPELETERIREKVR